MMRQLLILLASCAVAIGANVTNVYSGMRVWPGVQFSTVYAQDISDPHMLLWLPLNGNTFDYSGHRNHGTWCGYAQHLAAPLYTNTGAATIGLFTNSDCVLLRFPVVLTNDFTILVGAVNLASASFQNGLINSITYKIDGTSSRGFYFYGNASACYFRKEQVTGAGDSPFMSVFVGTNSSPMRWFALQRTNNNWFMWRDGAAGAEFVPFHSDYHTFSAPVTIRGVGSRASDASTATFSMGGVRIYDYALTSNQLYAAASDSLLASEVKDSTLNGNDIIIQTPTNFSWQAKYPLIIYAHGAGDTVESPLAVPGVDGGRAAFYAGPVSNGWIVATSSGGGDGVNNNSGWGNAANVSAYKDLVDWCYANYPLNGKVVIGCGSMGGMAALQLFGYKPEMTNVWGTYPVFDLYAMVTNSYNSFYYSNLVAKAWGFTNMAGFTNAVSSYNPMWKPAAQFTGGRFGFVGSYADTVVYRAKNIDAFTNLVGSTANSITALTSYGEHGDASNWTNVTAFKVWLQ